jgi:hypothetical protein
MDNEMTKTLLELKNLKLDLRSIFVFSHLSLSIKDKNKNITK